MGENDILSHKNADVKYRGTPLIQLPMGQKSLVILTGYGQIITACKKKGAAKRKTTEKDSII